MLAQFIQFFSSHQAILAGAGIAVLDLIFALSKKFESNGLLHAIYMFLKGKKDGAAQ